MSVRRVVLVVFAIALGWNGAAYADAFGDPQALAREVHEAGDYPDSLVLGDDTVWPRDVGPDGTTKERKRRPAPKPKSPPPAPASLPLASLGLPALIVVMAIVAAFALWIVWTLRRERTWKTQLDPTTTALPAGPDGVPEEDADPDALAAAGRYGDAVCALQRRALRRLGVPFANTAREAVRAIPPDDARKEPLTRLVRLAEAAQFAQYAVSAQEYRGAQADARVVL